MSGRGGGAETPVRQGGGSASAHRLSVTYKLGSPSWAASPPLLEPGAAAHQPGRRLKTTRSRARIADTSCEPGALTGAFNDLPVELVECILLYCGATELAALSCTSRHWATCDLVSRVALLQLRALQSPLLNVFRAPQAEAPLRLLAFSQRVAAARRVGGSLALGAYHSAALLRGAAGAARLYTFGRGFHGQLGHGGYVDALRPTAVEACVPDVLTLHCGGSHCAALCADGRLYTWGLASSGELGHGGWTPIEVDVPRCIDAFVGKVLVRRVVTGTNHTLAIGECGGLWACGRGRCGQLGQGDFSDAGPMRRVERLRGERVTQAAAGGAHSLALTAAGEVWSWGEARSGQLGQGAEVMQLAAGGWEAGVPQPARMVLPASTLLDPIADVAAGGHHSVLRTVGGRLLACGRGRHGALGLGDDFDYHTLSEVMPFCGGNGRAQPRCLCRLGGSVASRVVAVAAGRDHTLVLSACGAVLGTGCNNYGCLGTGDTVSRAAFARVPGLPRIQAIAAGESHSGAVDTAGRLHIWGRGDWGQLGLGDVRSQWRPATMQGWLVEHGAAE